MASEVKNSLFLELFSLNYLCDQVSRDLYWSKNDFYRVMMTNRAPWLSIRCTKATIVGEDLILGSGPCCITGDKNYLLLDHVFI